MAREETALTLAQNMDAASIFASQEALESAVGEIETFVGGIVIDITTPKGRENCKSVAYQTSRAKTVIDGYGKKVQEDARATVDRVNGLRRIAVDRLELLASEVRKPVTEYEAREESRVDGHKAAIIEIEALARFDSEPVEDVVAWRLEKLGGVAQRDFEEFGGRATQAIDQTRTTLNAHAIAAKARRIEAEELAKREAIRAEEERKAAAEAQALREAEIARQAAIDATRRAEEAAARELEAAEKRRADAEAQAEADRLRAEKEKLDAIEDARRAEEAHKAEIEAAKRRAQELSAKAVEDERRRVADEAAALRAEEERRARNRAHCSRINNEALAAIVALGIEVVPAKALIGSIAKGQIPHISITY